MNDSRKRRPTLQEIADLTGVTKMTVSRYLRDSQAVAEATQERTAAARAMVTEMLSRGRRRPIYLGARLDVRTRLRMEGYDRAMAEANLPGCHLLTERASSFTLGGNCWSRLWPSIRISMASTAPTTISRSAPCCAARRWA
jgi:DNA-binding LacI/PurR family transcriptional regulator